VAIEWQDTQKAVVLENCDPQWNAAPAMAAAATPAAKIANQRPIERQERVLLAPTSDSTVTVLARR